MFDYTIIIGRFQPIHDGHVRLIRHAISTSKKVILGIGSSNAGRSPRNPFTFEERVSLIQSEFSHGRIQEDHDLLQKLRFVPIDDMLYNDTEWTAQVRHRINTAIRNNGDDPTKVNVALSGYEKDSTSYYLRFFPEWKQNFVNFIEPYHSTDIREFFYKRALKLRAGQTIQPVQPDMVYGNDIGLSQMSGLFYDTDLQNVLYQLAYEWDFNKCYDPSKYPVTVVTADAVVVCNGHILLVKRKHKPGKGKWALPGGHIDPNESVKDAAVRELREETKISVGKNALNSSIKTYELFDHPQRSERARVITTAFLFKLENFDKLPEVKGSDDAAEAVWFPVGEVRKDQLFEDHFDIIKKLIQ